MNTMSEREEARQSESYKTAQLSALSTESGCSPCSNQDPKDVRVYKLSQWGAASPGLKMAVVLSTRLKDITASQNKTQE